MRAAPPVPCSAVMTLSRTNRPLAAVAWLVKLAPSGETRMSKSRVLKLVLSPPAPAWRTVNDTIERVEPRSTWRNLVPATSEHHLSLVPPDTLPLNAFSGPSLLLHGVEPVAGRFKATLVGPVPPLASNDGGASAAAAPHEVFAVVPRV